MDQAAFDLRPSERVGDALTRIRRQSGGDVGLMGQWFELLFMQFARQYPEFDVEEIWRWRDWPERRSRTGLDGRDFGIDLVATLRSGECVAVQCKCYAESHVVSKPDIDKFMSFSSREAFQLRWFVATSAWGKGAEEAISGKGVSPPVRRIDIRQYEDEEVLEVGKPPPKRYPYDLQLSAISNVVDGLGAQGHERGRLVMACGTGKTFVSLRASEQLVPDDGCVLFAAPTIALVSQARAEWLRHTVRPMSAIVVCSDSTAGGRGESQTVGPDSLVCPVRSKAVDVAAHLKYMHGVKVVFSTYQSLRKCVIAAQSEHGAPKFDLAIADEAHRTTGVDDGDQRPFQDFHDEESLKARKRLYMTATQRMYTRSSKEALASKALKVVDMSDAETYGPLLHRVKFAEAVNAGRLSDYRVIVLCVNKTDALTPSVRNLANEQRRKAKIRDDDITRLFGVSLAINGHVEGHVGDKPPGALGRTIAFANTIARSKWYEASINDPNLRTRVTRRIRSEAGSEAEAALRVVAKHLDGTSSALDRNEELRKLRQAPGLRECRVVCNAKLFTEGVDVPELDAVAFLDPRKSPIDIVQAVGRVMRKSEGKEFGYIIVPIAVEPDESVNVALSQGKDGYKAVGDVLRALQSHDERLVEDVARFVKVVAPPERPGIPTGGESEDGPWQSVLPMEDLDSNIYAQVTAAFGLGRRGKVTADRITDYVRSAAAALRRDDAAEPIATTLNLPWPSGPSATPESIRKAEKESCTIGALLLCNACLLHKRLLKAVEIPGVSDLAEVARSKKPTSDLIPSWRAILKKDYSAAFGPALAVLLSLESGRQAEDAIRMLAECAEELADSLSEMGYDHAGPLYHQILGTAKSDGAFYTKNISALMLARLALNDQSAHWRNLESASGLRMLDPACGTGTLLMAAVKTIKDLGQAKGQFRPRDIERLHRQLVERSVHGLDINQYAVQLAASSLTLGSPTVDYESMHLHVMSHGPNSDGTASTGSLELLPEAVYGRPPNLIKRSETVRLLNALGIVTESKEGGGGFYDLDLVLMNPPFSVNTESSAKFGSIGQATMRKRENAISRIIAEKDPLAGRALSKKTTRPFFTVLADCLLKDDYGTLGMVIPYAACTSKTGIGERCFLADRFEISVIVTSHDPAHLGFSENTSIHECLVVCHRMPAEKRKDTLFVSVSRMPDTVDDAINATDAILQEEMVSKWVKCARWPKQLVALGDWSPTQWLNLELANAARELCNHSMLSPLGDLAHLGPAHVRADLRNPIRDPSAGPYRVLWRHQTGKMQTMWAPWEAEVAAKLGSERKAKTTLLPQASRLLVANRLQTTATRVTSVLLDKPALGSQWTPIAPPENGDQGSSLKIQKAWCVWLNSTLGVLGFLHRRGRKLTYSDFMPSMLRSMPCPDPRKSDINLLAYVYDELRLMHLHPWSEMAECPVRKQLDNAVADAIGMDRCKVAEIRDSIVHEPTVSGVSFSDED